MKPSTRKLLEAAASYGKQNSGYGFSTARLIKAALENEDQPVSDDAIAEVAKMLVRHNHRDPTEIEEDGLERWEHPTFITQAWRICMFFGLTIPEQFARHYPNDGILDQ